MDSPIEKEFTASVGIPPRLANWPSLPPRALTIALAGMAFAGAVLFLFDPARYGFYPFCAFYRTTGWLCPGCGSLRAIHRLLHGQVLDALHFNALLVFSLPILAGFAFQTFLRRRRSEAVRIRPVWLWSAGAVLVLFGLLRNLPFAHSAWLAP